MNEPKQFKVVLRRENGRFVKEATRQSKYAAKQLADRWDEKHPEMYTEIERVEGAQVACTDRRECLAATHSPNCPWEHSA